MNGTPDTPVLIVGGGQSGMSAAHAVREAGLEAVILEAGDRPVGSWPLYYDINVSATIIEGGGHITPDTGYGPWPFAAEWCLRTQPRI
jgi:monoamine oxidase